jgi:DNA-binding NarL/FixJ family response regulator
MRAPLRLLIVADSGDEVLQLVGGRRRGVAFLKTGVSGFSPSEDPAGRIAALPERGRKIVVIDYLMANGGGDAALRLLRRNGLSRHAIVVSARVCEDKAAKTLMGGAYDYILKGDLTPLPASIAQELQAAESGGMRGPRGLPPVGAA